MSLVSRSDLTASRRESRDKTLAVNVAMFWPGAIGTLNGLRTLLRPGGSIALPHQPRQRGATHSHAVEAGRQLADQAYPQKR